MQLKEKRLADGPLFMCMWAEHVCVGFYLYIQCGPDSQKKKKIIIQCGPRLSVCFGFEKAISADGPKIES